MSYGKMVRQFHAVTDSILHAELTEEQFLTRMRLIGEEWEEFSREVACVNLKRPDANFAKEAIDLIYVVIGTLEAMGFDTDKVMRRVHASNMSKVDPVTGKVLRRADGKILKGESYKPAVLDDLVPNYCSVINLTDRRGRNRSA